MTVIIKEGEWLTHEGGELYARALRDIELHSVIRSDDFELLNGKKPDPHTEIPTDVIVLGPFGNAWMVNVNGEWRDIATYGNGTDHSEP